LSLGENSLVAVYQGKGKRAVDHQRTRVVTVTKFTTVRELVWASWNEGVLNIMLLAKKLLKWLWLS